MIDALVGLGLYDLQFLPVILLGWVGVHGVDGLKAGH